jgi:hypothetical protein
MSVNNKLTHAIKDRVVQNFLTIVEPGNSVIGAPIGAPGDLPVPTPVGLERDGKILIRPFCPPYYRDMEEAVLAFVDYKYARGLRNLS